MIRKSPTTALILAVFLAGVTPASAQQSPFAANPAENPFAAAQEERYEGTFESDDVKLTLKKEGEGFTGELFYTATNQTYPVTANLVGDHIEGHFATGGKQYPYSLTLSPDGKSCVFDTEGFQGILQTKKSVLTGSSIGGQAGELLAEAIAIRDTLGPVEAPAVTSAVALAMAQGGEWDRAKNLVETLPQTVEYRAWTIQTVTDEIAVSKAQIGDYAGVKALIEEAPLEGLVREVSVDKFAAIYAEAGNFEQVRALMDTIPMHHDRRPEIAQKLIVVLADKGDVAGAKMLVGNISPASAMKKYYFTWANYDIATAQFRKGDAQSAEVTLRNSIAQTQTDPTFAKILGPGEFMKGIIHALKKLTAEGNFTQVLALRDTFERSIKALPRHVHKIEAVKKIEGYAAIAEAQFATEDAAGAKKTISKARSLLKKVAGPMKGFAQRPIAQVEALMGDTKRAEEYIGKSQGVLPRMIAYGDLAQAQAKAGNLAGANQTLLVAHANLAHNRNLPQGGNFNLGGMIKSAFAVGNFVQGGSMSMGSVAKLGGGLMRANKQTPAGPDYAAQEAHAKQVASAYTHYAHVVGSIDGLPDQDLLINVIQEPETRSLIYYRIATRQMESGDFDAAQRTAAGISDPDIKSGFLTSLVSAMASNGDVERALAAANAEKVPITRAIKLSQIAGTLLKREKQASVH